MSYDTHPEPKTIQITREQISKMLVGERVYILGPLANPIRILNVDRIALTVTYQEIDDVR